MSRLLMFHVSEITQRSSQPLKRCEADCASGLHAAVVSRRLMYQNSDFLFGKITSDPTGLMLVFHDRQATNLSGLLSGLNVFSEETSTISTLKELLFNLCQDCEESMSCIPPSAFSAKHVRESQRDMKVAAAPANQEPSSKYFNTVLLALSPLQYNSKMMNSVWGLYNRYSSHNVKTNNDVCVQQSQEVQQSAVSSKNDAIINIPAKVKLDNIWAAFNFSQSH